MTTKHTSNQLEQLLQLATRGDLVSFLLDYAEENSSFRCDLQSYLGSKYMDNEDTIDDYIDMMKNAFYQTKI